MTEPAGIDTSMRSVAVTVPSGDPVAGRSSGLSGVAGMLGMAGMVTCAHRGASARAPENTLAAFAAAADLGADTVELDVRRTRDGHLVALHDATLGRTTDVARVYPERAGDPVHTFSLAELRRLDAGAWFGAAYAGERVPTLTEAMDVLAARGLGLLLEVKEPTRYPGMARQLAAELRDQHPDWLRSAAGRLTVESFDWHFVLDLRAALPRVSVGLLGTPDRRALARYAGHTDQVNPSSGDVTPDYVEEIHQYGMAVNAWTVDDEAELARVVGAGVDGIITNHPDRARAVVRDSAAAGRRSCPGRCGGGCAGHGPGHGGDRLTALSGHGDAGDAGWSGTQRRRADRTGA